MLAVVVSVLCVLHPLAFIQVWPPVSPDETGVIDKGARRVYWTLSKTTGVRHLRMRSRSGRPQGSGAPDYLVTGTLPRWVSVHAMGLGRESDDPGGEYYGQVIGYGLPFTAARSMKCGGSETSFKVAGIDPGDAFGLHELVPTWVYWPGLLADLAIWLTVVPGLMIFFDAWIGLRRIRRGRCVRCGYEIGVGATACPECGVGMGETERRRDGETKRRGAGGAHFGGW